MKGFLIFVLLTGLVAAALFAPIGGRSFCVRAHEHGIPRAAALATAHGLRSAWDWLGSLGHPAAGGTRDGPAHSPRHASRKAQAAQPPGPRASREGILAQPPKERLESADRAALDALIKR
jgi:hypothetical protein